MPSSMKLSLLDYLNHYRQSILTIPTINKINPNPTKTMSHPTIISLQFESNIMEMLNDDTSKKAINYAPTDPCLPIFRQLKDQNAKEGDYFRIVDREMRFIPIYKITLIIEPNINTAEDSIISRKSMYYKQSANEIIINPKPQKESPNKFRLSFGSQIYLKNADLSRAKIDILRPYFSNLYVWLKPKNKGYIQIRDDRIFYHQTMHTSSIWLCMLVNQYSSEQSSQKEVVFCNFDDGSYLHLDESGVFMTCAEDRATKFTLRNKSGSNPNSYIVQGKNVLSIMVKNKSKEEIKKIIDRNIERNAQKVGTRRILQTQLDIIPIQDSYVTIQLELNYSLIALQMDPSLKLIKTIFDELIYYGILQFTTDSSLINDHLQKLLLQKNIFHGINEYLIRYFQNKKKEMRRYGDVVINSPKKKSSFILSNDPRAYDKVDECASIEMQAKDKTEVQQNQEISELLSTINVICKRNHFISQIFLPLLNLLIQYDYFELASQLLHKNQYFINQFYKLGWYNLLYKKLKATKKQTPKIIAFLCQFCESQGISDPNTSTFTYKQLPSTNNQYLIYNSIRSGQNYSKIFQFQLYSEGLYIFVHNSKSDKDIEFHTFIQDLQSELEGQSGQHLLIKNHGESIITQEQKLLFAQLLFLKAVSSNYNINVYMNHWQVVYALAPYCYRDSYPNLKNSIARKSILELIIACEITSKDCLIFSKNAISYILTKGAQDKRILAEEVGDFGDFKSDLGLFIRDFRKITQNSRKIVKEMGDYFLKKTKTTTELLKLKQFKIAQIYQNNQKTCLLQWLKIMHIYLLKRMTKVKQKKEGQLISYIKKFFETVQKQKKNVQSEQNLITSFIEFLLELLKFNVRYQSYLNHVKVKRNYQGKLTNQINKVISNFQTKKDVSFTRKQKTFTKIQFINIIYKSIQKQNERYQLQKQQKDTVPIKIVVSNILQIILQTTKQETVDESVQTLNYLIKNSTDMSSVSSFSLLQMMNKFPMENHMKQVVLQQWYFASNCKYFNQLTSILRLLYNKKLDFRTSINQVYLFDKPQLLKVFHNLIYPAKFIKKMCFCCQTWLRQSLFDKFDKYGDIYQIVLKYLEIINGQLQKLKMQGQDVFVSKLIQNLNILKSLASLVEYISSFYIQKQMNRLKQPRLFNISSSLNFFELKLNLLSSNILKIFNCYVMSNTQIKLRQSKIFLHIFGNTFSKTLFFSQMIVKIFWEAQLQTKINRVTLLNFTPMDTITKICEYLPYTWPFLQIYCQLSGQELVHQVQRLLKVGFKRQQPEIQYYLELIFVSPIDYKPQNEQQNKFTLLKQLLSYEFMHQNVFLKLVYKLICLGIKIEFVEWFRDKLFWGLLQHVSDSAFQKPHKAKQINIYQLQRKRLICQLAFEFRHQRAFAHNAQDVLLSQMDHLIIQYLRDELKDCRQKIPINHQSPIDNINDHLKIEYLQYIVCDLPALSKEVQFIKDENVIFYFRQCCKLLKEHYKIRIIQKQNDNTPAFIAKSDRILFGQPQEELSLRRLVYKIFEPQEQKKAERTEKSKPLKKWDKAVQQLNNVKSLSKTSELVQDMIEFNNIYEFKSQNEDLNFVVNHQDFFLKLVQTSLNTKRLDISQQNQIFIMQQLFLAAKKKIKNISLQLIEYAMRLLQNIAQQQDIDNIQQANFGYAQWKTNIYVLSLKLQIISLSKLFDCRRQTSNISSHLVPLFKMAVANYHKDFAFFELYRSTFYSKEEKQYCEFLLPFDIILNIIIQQVTLDGMGENQFDFCIQIVKSLHLLNPQEECQFVKYRRGDLSRIIQKMQKNIVIQIHNQLKSSLYFNHLLTLKK